TFVGTGINYASTPPIAFPPPGASPNSGEFTAAWQAVSAGLGRINLNQSYTNEFPVLGTVGSSCFNFTTAAVITKYQKAYQEWVNNPANNGYAAYQLLLCDAAGNSTAIPDPANPTGTPQGVRKTIKDYNPAMTTQPLVLSGDELNLVRTANSGDPAYDPTPVHA